MGLAAATFESAGPKGDGERRSFVPVLSDKVELDVERVLEADDLSGCARLGNEPGRDFVEALATRVGTGAAADAAEGLVVVRGELELELDAPDSTEGVSNSGGRVCENQMNERIKMSTKSNMAIGTTWRTFGVA